MAANTELTKSQQAVIDAMNDGARLAVDPITGAHLIRSSELAKKHGVAPMERVSIKTFDALRSKRAIKRPIKGGTEFTFNGYGDFIVA
jgi:hypothetical protein